MTKDEALKMAIEAFKTCETYNAYEQSFETILVEKALNACKEALNIANCDLKQPAQDASEQAPCEQPVAWMNDIAFSMDKELLGTRSRIVPLYTHPAPAKEFVTLTDDEVDDFMFQSCDAENGYSITDLIRLVEQALKDKNT